MGHLADMLFFSLLKWPEDILHSEILFNVKLLEMEEKIHISDLS
jgi:hypothetical protein